MDAGHWTRDTGQKDCWTRDKRHWTKGNHCDGHWAEPKWAEQIVEARTLRRTNNLILLSKRGQWTKGLLRLSQLLLRRDFIASIVLDIIVGVPSPIAIGMHSINSIILGPPLNYAAITSIILGPPLNCAAITSIFLGPPLNCAALRSGTKFSLRILE